MDPEYFGLYNFLQCMRDKFHKGDLPAKECNILLATGARLDYVKPPPKMLLKEQSTSHV